MELGGGGGANPEIMMPYYSKKIKQGKCTFTYL
jgi:hypothetical protein